MAWRPAEAAASVFAALAALLLVGVPASGHGQAGGVIYCCDSAGQVVCGDILPAVCYGRDYREVNPSGTVRRYVPAPLRPEEAARREAEERRLRAEHNERLRQQRLDKALIDTYRSLDDLDLRRDREVGELDASIRALRARETELLARRAQLAERLAAVGADGARARLDDDARRIDGELSAQRSVIDAKLRERAAVLDRFAGDRQRYLRLSPGSESAARR